jgi:hypothetical protein
MRDAQQRSGVIGEESPVDHLYDGSGKIVSRKALLAMYVRKYASSLTPVVRRCPLTEGTPHDFL